MGSWERWTMGEASWGAVLERMESARGREASPTLWTELSGDATSRVVYDRGEPAGLELVLDDPAPMSSVDEQVAWLARPRRIARNFPIAFIIVAIVRSENASAISRSVGGVIRRRVKPRASSGCVPSSVTQLATRNSFIRILFSGFLFNRPCST